MTIHPKITLETVMDAVTRYQICLDNSGFCNACGCEVDGVEPDARNYECEACGEHEVYGCQELLLEMVP